MKIFVPTYNRVNKRMQKTMAAIPTEFHHLVTMVVYDNEVDGLRELFPAANFAVCPEGVRGITKKREYIVKELCGDELIWMIDDDVAFKKVVGFKDYMCNINGKKVPKPCAVYNKKDEPWPFQELLDHIETVSKTCPSGGVWVSTSPVDKHNVPGIVNKRWHTNTYFDFSQIDKHAIVWNDPQFADCQVFPEDFAVTCQIRALGHDVIAITKFVAKVAETNSKGGLSDIRTAEVHNHGMERFIEVYSPFIKRVYKDNKGWTKFILDLKEFDATGWSL